MEQNLKIKKLKVEMRNTATSDELGGWLGLTVKEIAAHANLLVKARGGYALKKTVQSFCTHVRAQASGRESEAVKQRRRLIRSQADYAETRANIESGGLLDAAEVEAAWSTTLRSVRAM